MNNALIIDNKLEEMTEVPSALLRERATQLADIIDALQSIGSSSHWKVLQKYVFEVDLDKAKRRLAKEKDTTEMFRLQGELRWEDRISLDKLTAKYRGELQAIRQKIHE